jgi:DNA mismatch repair protein MutL
MSRIRILSEHLANQIAAGEVVERPASVVKELLENSLDAGASRIDIQVEGGGTRLIRIADNGEGMDGDDVLLAIERHATSKLLDESQLAAIATLGFRGEALPSIGSVSRLTILSRTRHGTTGTRADIRYGILHDVHEEGCARGTIIEVRSLFGNLPARKKFLKTKRTELSHIDEVIRAQSLAHPEVAFSLQVDGRQMFSLSSVDLQTRVCDVFRYDDKLIPIEAADESRELAVSGYLLLPDASSSRLRILVNSRPVQDRMIRHAVMEGLQGFLMKGHKPAGALLLTLSPELVDVNVHPAKREIRFRNSASVHRFLVQAVADGIQNHQEQVRGALFHVPEQAENKVELPADTSAVTVHEPVQNSLPVSHNSKVSLNLTDVSREVAGKEDPVMHRPDNSFADISRDCEQRKQAGAGTTPSPISQTESGCHLTLIGQFLNLYLLCERDGQLIVIDQHAAHERILYQRLRHGYENRELASQALLFPVTVDLGPDHAQTLEKEEDSVKSLGLDVVFFGDSTWVIKALPALVAHLAPQEVLTDILDGLRNSSSAGFSGVVPECIDNLLASMACKAAIKAGNRLQPQEMIELLQQMENSDVFSHCPHGRPVIKVFSSQEVEKWFHRT